MQTEYLKTVLKLAQTGHYTITSKELFLSMTALHHQVKKVEKELGFRLFKIPGGCHRAGVVPTDEGATFLYFASQALAMLEDGRLEAVEKAS